MSLTAYGRILGMSRLIGLRNLERMPRGLACALSACVEGLRGQLIFPCHGQQAPKFSPSSALPCSRAGLSVPPAR